MVKNKSISIVAQTQTGKFSDTDIQYFGNDFVGINTEIGLMALARSEGEGKSSIAHKSIEILMDDMELNLNAEAIQTKFDETIQASRCLTESLDNINEYLSSRSSSLTPVETRKGVEMAVIQIGINRISYYCNKYFSALKFSEEQLLELDKTPEPHTPLGVDTELEPEVHEKAFSDGDIVLLLPSAVLNELGLEFIRVTISRFQENLEMVLRQINMRTLQNGLKFKHSMIICHKNQVIEQKKSWLGKLIN